MEKGRLATIGLLLFSIACTALVFAHPPKIGGDIVEYVGITQTLTSHASLSLKDQDKAEIKKIIGPIYQENEEYYLKGRNDNRYPTHFPLYSILAMPMRQVLHALNLNELLSFSLVNITILFLTCLYVLKKGLEKESEKIPFLILLIASPILFYITWPGPELLLMCLLLLGLFLLKNGRFSLGILCMIIASWQSQPILLIPLALLLARMVSDYKKKGFSIKPIFLALLIFIPNIYYFLLFESPTAFVKLTDFGLQNFTLQKPLELFFDLNFGLFFYGPALFVFALFGAIHYRKKELLPLIVICAATAISYTTITNWNHGAPGYGPNRYSLFLMPFLLFLATYFVSKNKWKDYLLALFLIVQLPILIFNGLLFPNYNDSFGHSPYAKAILSRSPSLYNPTPEIFIERTLGTESGGSLETAVYFAQNRCRKAYVFKIDVQKVKDACGYIPQEDIDLLTNEFLKPSNSTRIFTAKAATLYPEGIDCGQDPTICLNSLKQVMERTGVKDAQRISPSTVVKGAWVIAWGTPVSIILPPHYIAQFAELEGRYINY